SEDGFGQRLDGVEISDGHDVRRELLCLGTREPHGLLEPLAAQVEGCDARPPREQAQDELTADAVPASGDGDGLAFNLHDVSLRSSTLRTLPTRRGWLTGLSGSAVRCGSAPFVWRAAGAGGTIV